MAGDVHPDLGGGGGVWHALDRWIAEGRVDEAARARARRASLRDQAAASTTLAAIVADLADRGRAVMLHTASGNRHRGRIAAFGVDFVAVETDTGALVLVAHASLAAVRTEAGDPPMRSMRAPDLSAELAQVLALLAEERPRVAITTTAPPVVAGKLIAVGVDVVTVRLDGDLRATVYVPLGAIAEVLRPAR